MAKNTQDETRKEMARLVESLSQNLLKLSTLVTNTADQNKRKIKKSIDKNKPKQALSSFMYYNLANRERVISKHPGIKVTEISTLLGKEWRTLKEDQKNLWKDYAEKDKERYKKEIEKYNNNLINQSNKEEIQEPEKKKPRKEELKGQDQKHNNDNDNNGNGNLINQSNEKQIQELEKKKPRKELKEQNQNKQKSTASFNEVKSDLKKKKKVTFNDNTKDLKFKTIGSIQSKKLAKVAKRKTRKNKMQQFIVTDRK